MSGRSRSGRDSAQHENAGKVEKCVLMEVETLLLDQKELYRMMSLIK